MAEFFDRYKELELERRGNGVLLITLNRPDVLNAMTYAMHAELARIWTDVDNDPATRVAVVTGAGRAFCAGNDLRNPDPDFDGVRDIMRDAVGIVRGMMECDKPIISAINGVAVGAGLAVALSTCARGGRTARSHRRSVWSSLAVASQRPSGEMPTAATELSWPARTWGGWTWWRSHRWTRLSSLPATSQRPSAESASERMASRAPERTIENRVSSSSVMFHRRALPSALPE